MKTFAQKQNQHQKPVALPSPRTIGNHAVQPTLQIHAEELKAGSTGTTLPRVGHDFSRIPIHPHASSAAVSSPGDAYEREADAVADRVMRMAAPAPELSAAAAPARRDRYREGKADLMRRKATAAAGAGATSATGLALNVAAEGGMPLTAELRAFFEPRFGHDLGHVRLHVGDGAAEGAQAVQAEAYTVGSDIVFGAGHYAPSTTEGRHLLAHELAHVVQQHTSPALISRKIKCDPSASLSGFFSGKGVSNVTDSDGVYGHAKGGALTFEQEILIDMLASPRVFNVDGDSNQTVASKLNAHVKARTGIVTFASQKKYSFAALAGWKMNRTYYDWDTSKGTWKMKPDVDKQAASDDLNDNPQEYAIGCAAATDLTMRGGSKGAKIIDKPSSDTTDWVPGDAGYIENLSYQPSSGQIGIMGENIIYTGNSQFWGHLPGTVTHRPLADWIKEVKSWTAGGGKAKVDDKREMPATGLLDT